MDLKAFCDGYKREMKGEDCYYTMERWQDRLNWDVEQGDSINSEREYNIISDT